MSNTDGLAPARQGADTQAAYVVALTPSSAMAPSARAAFAMAGARMEETLRLALAAGFAPVAQGKVMIDRPPGPAGARLSATRAQALGAQARDSGAEAIVVDGHLTALTQRAIERAAKLEVADRTAIILKIFARRARSREGRLQVELARLSWMSARLVRHWTHLERQRGGTGSTGGPGETQLESDKRALGNRIKRIRGQLAQVRARRTLHRHGRKRQGLGAIALVGYTNAGKTSLFNALVGARALAMDAPFATLDSLRRGLRFRDGGRATLSDTVGFIHDLPSHLVDAFRSTLEDALDADIIVHVRDSADPLAPERAEDVHAALEAVGALKGKKEGGAVLIEAHNKCDLPDAAAHLVPHPLALAHVRVSAQARHGLDDLRAVLAGALRAQTPRARVRLKLPLADGAARAWLYAHALAIHETPAAGGGAGMEVSLVHAILSTPDAGRLQKNFPALRARIAHR